MALPKLNDLPKYEIAIPSTKQKVKFRPYLVKEQKILLIALESQEQKQILNAIIDTIKSCIVDDIKVDRLTTFDIEYLFTKIRAKSVGETSKVKIKCSSCEHPNTVSIKLDDIKVQDNNTSNKIVLNDQFTLQMRYPTYLDVVKNDSSSSSSAAEQLYSSIILCMDKLITQDEQIDLKDETYKEKETFLDSLTNEQFEKIATFMNNMPGLRYTAEFTCSHCHTENKYTLTGMKDFF